MKITIYDGADTVGGNKIYVENDSGGIFLDFGLNFARYGEYFEEFLRERSTRGIHDSLYLELIPKLDIYREDMVPSDVDVSEFSKINLKAVAISHAHLDHCGNIGFIREDIPIIASPTTLAILKAMRDSGRLSGGMEIMYHSRREPAEDSRVLRAMKNAPYCGRDLISTGSMGEELLKFLADRPGKKKIEGGKIYDLDEASLPFDIESFEVDHSIFGAVGYIIHGDSMLAYTGDLRLHGRNARKTIEFIQRARDCSVLIVEGTRAAREEDVNVLEAEVFENCLEIVESENGLVIADFSPRNFERLEAFAEIASRTGRILVVTAKDAYMMHALELADGIDRMKDLLIYRELKYKRDRWETDVVMSRWEDKYIDPESIRRNPDEYILCFSFYDMKHLLDIKVKGGAYVYSSSEAFSEEQEFDFIRLHRWLETFGFRVYGFEIVPGSRRPEPRFVKGFHTSGHVSKEDLRWIVDTVDPDILIPVHTENPEWFLKEFQSTKILKNGDTMII